MEECSGVRVARDFERSTLFPIDLCIAYKCNRSWKEQHPKRVNELHIESGTTLQDEYYYLDEWNVRECVWARERKLTTKILHSFMFELSLTQLFSFAVGTINIGSVHGARVCLCRVWDANFDL